MESTIRCTVEIADSVVKKHKKKGSAEIKNYVTVAVILIARFWTIKSDEDCCRQGYDVV